MNVRGSNFVLNSNAPRAAAARVAVRVAARTNFEYFPKLPVELRLKIWRRSLPPSRKINICPFSEVTTLQSGSPPLPITLYVNSESRTETLRYYTVILRRDFLPHYFWKDYPTSSGIIPRRFEIPLCFCASVDSLYLPSYSMIEERTMEWVMFLSPRVPGGLKTVRNLQINNIYESHIRDPTPQDAALYGGFDQRFSCIKLFLRSFEGLEQLTFTFHDTTGDLRQLPRSSQAFKDMVNRVTGGGIAPGRKWAGYLGFEQSAPKNITFEPFRPITVYTHGNERLDIWNSIE